MGLFKKIRQKENGKTRDGKTENIVLKDNSFGEEPLQSCEFIDLETTDGTSIYLGNLSGPPRCCGFEDLYYDKDRNKLRIYSEWPGSADAADTKSEERYVDYEYAVKWLEESLKYYPENRKGLNYLESIKGKV